MKVPREVFPLVTFVAGACVAGTALGARNLARQVAADAKQRKLGE